MVNYKEPSITPIERAEAEELKKMEAKIQKMKIRLLELKKKSEQTESIENNESIERKREIVFRGDQENVIKNNLGQMYVLYRVIKIYYYYCYCYYAIKNLFLLFLRGKDIKELITEVKKLEEEVSI